MHWRSDGIEGLKLGEDGIIGFMKDLGLACTEEFLGFALTQFDGMTITV